MSFIVNTSSVLYFGSSSNGRSRGHASGVSRCGMSDVPFGLLIGIDW